MSRRTRGLSNKDVESYLDIDFPSGSELESDVNDSDKDPDYENEFILSSSDSDYDLVDTNNQNDINILALIETSISSTSR